MYIIDTHAHIYVKELLVKIDEVILRAKLANIKCILMPSLNLDSLENMILLKKNFPNYVHNMVGIHPLYVNDDFLKNLYDIEKVLHYESIVAIGEIGLDFYSADEKFYKLQILAFELQIQLAKKFKLPVVVHSRKSLNEVLHILKSLQDEDLRGVIHCFTGEIEDIYKFIDLGFYFGINGILTFKNSNIKDLVKKIPMSSILLETDSPYLSPVPYRGKQNEPSYLKIIAQCLADLQKTSIEEVASITTQNTKNLFLVG